MLGCGCSLLHQSCTQSPLTFWSADVHQERLWGTGILLPQDFCGKTNYASCYEAANQTFFEFSSLSWRPPAGQRARGLWVRDYCCIVKFTSFQRDGRRCYEYLFACVKRNKMDSELLLKFIEYFPDCLSALSCMLLGFSWTTFVEIAVC